MPDSAGLEQTSSVPFLQRHGEAGVPRVEERDFPPMAGSCNLGVDFGNGIDRSPELIRSLLTPTAKRLHGEGHQASARESPRGVAPVLAVSCAGCRRAVHVSGRVEPRGAL